MSDKDTPIQVGSTIPFEVTLTDKSGSPLDISLATTKTVYLKSPVPSDSVLSKAAGFKTDGTDGILTYTTISSDLAVRGDWKIQGEIVAPTWGAKSEIGYFEVENNLS